jgi:hypothetical protein
MEIVGVNFIYGFDNRTTYYFKTDIKDLKEGDIVVVDSRGVFTIAKVVKTNPTLNSSFEVRKWVIDKINTTNYEIRIKKEKRLKEIKKKMDQRKKELQEIQIFELLAKDDEEMRVLLEEFKELSK